MEVRTEILSRAALEQHVGVVQQLCVEFAAATVDVTYGWACNLAIDDLYQDHRMSTSELLPFIARSVTDNIFRLGDSDMYIKDAGGVFEFTICHESDIHFESNDPSLVSRVTTLWSEHGLRSYEVA